ncbi:probable vesicular glutamate transporter eat-4 isoform X1 [Aphis gossypii]|uniref:probable vesicular glutamate transporter eat-4 isoform X1 n=1 Tax=Aphis gossypii TaxID=80765 RepID=UPI002159A922|nr:probable vesicular glutamate transporter eat-4 isoform X1 [Aphis gossypii]
MELGQTATSRWNSLPPIQARGPPSYKFIDRFSRLKTIYWNRGYAIFLLAFIGFTIQGNQLQFCLKIFESMKEKNKIDFIIYNYEYYYKSGFEIGLIPGGVLVTVYPVHNILGISVIISSICHIILIMSIGYLNAGSQIFLGFCIGTTMATVFVAIHRIWTYWVPLNKQSVRHVPIILCVLIDEYRRIYISNFHVHVSSSSFLFTILLGVIVLPWYLLWTYVTNNGNRSQILYRGSNSIGGVNYSRCSTEISGVLPTLPNVLEIPWKSFCTSMPVIAIVLSFTCIDSSIDSKFELDLTLRKHTIIWLILFTFLTELIPEITVSFSTTNVRKFWSCTYFVLIGIHFYLRGFWFIIITENNKLLLMTFKVMKYFSLFGFYVNHLDIAPKYASVIFGIIYTVNYMSLKFLDPVLVTLSGCKNKDYDILVAVKYLAVALFYAKYASAKLQPWADEPVEENQRNMIENVILPDAAI